MKRAISLGNVYLTADIDCEGKEFPVVTSYSGIFNGNGYTVSNFKVSKSGTGATPTVAIFKKLTSTAQIVNVKFENATYIFNDIKESAGAVKVTPKAAALAIEMVAGAKVQDVTVTGTLTTNYAGELACINSVYYFEGTPDEAVMAGVDSFSAEITVN